MVGRRRLNFPEQRSPTDGASGNVSFIASSVQIEPASSSAPSSVSPVSLASLLDMLSVLCNTPEGI